MPVAVKGLKGVRSIAAGGGFYLALLDNGTVKAWGENGNGQLGDGRTNERSTFPVTVNGLSGVVAVAAGNEFSLALLSDGTVMAWGHNSDGQLGTATPYGAKVDVPVAVGGLNGVAAVAAGTDDAYALLKDGTVMALGGSGYGALGDGSEETGETGEVPVAVSGLSEVKAISAGENGRFALALLKNGTVMAWGNNGDGQLGMEPAPPYDSDVPVAVSTLSEVAAISAGERHSLALLRSGAVVAWGNNDGGQLGDDTFTYSAVPVDVCGLSEVVGISAAGDHSLAYGPSPPMCPS